MNIRACCTALALASVVTGARVVHAQAASSTRSAIGRGAWIVSGSASWDHFDAPNQAVSSIAFAPSGLYFFRPRWAFGGSVNAARQRLNGATQSQFAVGPELRYDAEPGARTLPFVRAAFRPGWSRFNLDNSSTDATVRVLQGEVGAGITQLLSTHIGLTGELFYMKSKSHVTGSDGITDEPDTKATSYGVRFGFTAFVF